MVKMGSAGAPVRAIQHALGLLIDGSFGAKTREAVVNWQHENRLIADGVVGSQTWALLEKQLQVKESAKIDRGIFFTQIRSLFGRMSQSQVEGLNSLLDAVGGCLINEAAYMLATAYHETAHTMQPIEEYGKGRGRDYGKRLKMSRKPYSDTLPLYYGRGYVQLTWYENYDKAGRLLKLDLLRQPELALQADVAAKIMREGMFDGWFTGKKLNDYVGLRTADYVSARRIINGMDKAQFIAGYAVVFELALRKAKV